ncbi:PREDICTED: uncharacterized protein LOC108359692 [Rhagoletis zephyria]|uniref:uncharacterized protein LOC108359692 n=1 Tax=Rhagoletis zephyria TaxID=28612 RepID=UPI00081177C4|nr:PREDICTED: uncharacterized protein LOC108359692 [Rhagoletis zephyria]
MRVMQLNLNHCEAAQELLRQTVYEEKVNIAIISEQYKNIDSGAWISDLTGKAAIWTCGGKAFQEKPLLGKSYYTRAKVDGFNFYSCYIPPSIAGDFNAWAVEWGSVHTNRRGDALLKAFSVLDAVLLNSGNKNTFEKNGRGSVIDFTFASSSLVRSTSWKVSDLYTSSDHLAIMMELGNCAQSRQRAISRKVQTRGWKVETLDEELFRLVLDEEMATEDNTELQAETLVRHISKACDGAMCR